MGTSGVPSVWALSGDPGPTTKCTVQDTVRSLSELGVSLMNGEEFAKGALITCETNDIRFSVGGAAPSASNSSGHILEATGSIRLSNSQWVKDFKCINKTAASVGVIQVTIEF